MFVLRHAGRVDSSIYALSVWKDLKCVTSFCETHLTNHKTAPRLVRHKLIDPVDNLEDYICEKHEKPLEMFCRDDQTCLCLFCTDTEHKTHNTVPIEEESGHKRAQLKKTQAEVKVMIQDRIKKTEEIKSSEKFFSFPFPELNEWKVPRSTMEAGLVGMLEMSGVSRRLVAMGNTPPMTSQTVHSAHLLSPLHFSPPALRFSKVKRHI
ncbi:hypothetical protein G5714_008291 [Onychostoma macrolepis]|uniref:B box-type domain-containing protein n=1 Tax=Onychostoma macrolepis TaxID=369639 RepID=A0A7J6CVG6_9TELE|nr:hypothetical protein G5714_008291 [Onychostoma macrolepis]